MSEEIDKGRRFISPPPLSIDALTRMARQMDKNEFTAFVKDLILEMDESQLEQIRELVKE